MAQQLPREKASDLEAIPEEADHQDSSEPRTPSSETRRRRRPRRRPPRREHPPVERTMLVRADEDRTEIAVLEAGSIVEHYVARRDDRSLVGSIYLGRVQNVLPGMEASFVDIGESRNGVLYADEVGIADDTDEVPRIETVLKPGQSILVQVSKAPMHSKGARLTAAVSIPGRHLVLVPHGKTVGVSRRLPDAERNRLRTIAARIRPDDHGLIVRTAAQSADEVELERDLARLLATWEDIDRRAAASTAPALIYQEPELELRVIRDLFNRDVVRCVVDDRELESKLRVYVRSMSPDLDSRLELYAGELPIFEEFRVAEQIRKSLDRKVWLPSGGHIVMDRTEAMTVIDVNTGKFVGKSNLEETVFRTNREAAVEIGRQLRLRDIGGIIVIDFIDMEDAGNRDELIKVFRNELLRDRTRTQVFDISPLGLVQMTRKNVSAGIVEAFSVRCPTCEGRGILIHDVD
ncbi:MAG TPA: Rne/Rng family ribonuclease [Actinomycetota bacterium]|nr:Rne/Rng family ribonuclease [Actinomycetota bacterium]